MLYLFVFDICQFPLHVMEFLKSYETETETDNYLEGKFGIFFAYLGNGNSFHPNVDSLVRSLCIEKQRSVPF